MAEGADKGQLERHTQDPAARPDDADRPGDAPGGIDGRDLADLLAGSPDLGNTDLLAMAAEISAAPRRGRGRPPGAPNRKNADQIAYLQALGHRDPWVTLSMIQTADTKSLADALRSPARNKNGSPVKDADGNVVLQAPDLAGTLALQMQAASKLMEYHHAKMPVQLELPAGDKVPLMVIGEMTINQMGGSLGDFMSAGEVIEGEKPNEINGANVRMTDDHPHETDKPLKTKDDPTSTA